MLSHLSSGSQGDSLIRETFNELCDFVGAAKIIPVPKADARHTGAECSFGSGAAAAYVQFEWNAFGDYEPVRCAPPQARPPMLGPSCRPNPKPVISHTQHLLCHVDGHTPMTAARSACGFLVSKPTD